jgi:site-specific recombinase XerD
MNKNNKIRGVYEKVLDSGVWWINYFDSQGKRRREKAGRKSDAITLYQKRKTEALQGKKLPEKLRAKAVTFGELADDGREYCKRNNAGYGRSEKYRIQALKDQFGARNAESITPQDFERWFEEKEWQPATVNRFRTTLSMIYREGVSNKKVIGNPARLIRHRKGATERVRYLNERAADEEAKIRAAIMERYAEHLSEFEFALNTGMRKSEQYRSEWLHVNLERRQLFVPISKNGLSRHIPLNRTAVTVLSRLRKPGQTARIFVSMCQRGNHKSGTPLESSKHWFARAVKQAGVQDFTWHDLRHTFASRLVMAGVDLRTVQVLMGHKNIQMTCRYAHLAPSHTLAAVEQLVSDEKQLEQATATTTATEDFCQAEAESVVLM